MFRLTWDQGRPLAGRVLVWGVSLLLVACTSGPVAGSASSPEVIGRAGSAPATRSSSAVAHAAADRGTFTSGLYGYDIAFPAGWQPTPASSRWQSGALEGQCPSDWDCFTHGSDNRTLAVAAIDVPAALSLDQWRIRIHATQPTGCSDAGTMSSTSLGGDPAESWVLVCQGEGLTTIKMVAIHGRQGYVLIFASPSEDTLDADSSALAALVDTFSFAA